MPGALSQTAPGPILGALDKSRPQGVALDVATKSKKVKVTRHRKCFVPPLVDVAGASGPSPCVPSFAVSRSQPGHERRQFGVCAGPQHKMEMVWHETVRQTPDRNAHLRLAKHLEERPVISRSIKQPESANATIQDVKHDSSRSDPPSIWHGVAAIKFLANIRRERPRRNNGKLAFPFSSETTPEVFARVSV